MTTIETTDTVEVVELPVWADRLYVGDVMDDHMHLHLRCPALAATRPGVAAALAERYEHVLWVTWNPNVVPDGATHLDPHTARFGGALERFSVDGEPAAVVVDADALDSFDVADRLALVTMARAGGRFVRLARA